MDPKNFETMINIANRLKVAGNGTDYRVPNAIFCYLLDGYLRERPLGMAVSIESRDTDGRENIEEVYYDLFVVNYGNRKLSIPVPMLNFYAAITAMKVARVVERKEGQAPSYEEEDRRSLLKALGAVVPLREIFDATRVYLAEPLEPLPAELEAAKQKRGFDDDE